MTVGRESTWPSLLHEAFHYVAHAFKVVMVGNTGSGHAEVAVDSNGHLQVDVLSGGGGGSGEVTGTETNGATADPKPVVVGGRDPSDGHVHTASVGHITGPLYPWLSLLVDSSAHAIDITSNGELYGRVGSTDDTKANAKFIKTSSDGTIVLPAVTGTVTANPPTASEAAYNSARIAAASINGSGSSWATGLTAGNPIIWMVLINTTDVRIGISFNASTTHLILDKRAVIDVPYSLLSRIESSNVSVRSDETSAPSRGGVVINAMVTA